MKSDLLAGLSQKQRRERENADLEYILKQPEVRAADPKMRAILGQDDPKEPVEMCTCVRLDLDHPIQMEVNLFSTCVDCGCDIQYHPTVPAALDKLCVCCTARRMRENES